MNRLLTLILACGATLLLGACEKDSCEQTWTEVVPVPVTLNRAAVQDSIGIQPARELCTGGNLYAYGQYVFVNVNREGYHLLDNSDPAHPRNLAFLRVPGATHMAFVDGRMVSDSYADMLVLDFGGPTELSLVSSTPNLLLQTDGFTVEVDRVAIGFEDQEVEFTQSCAGDIVGRCNGCEFEGDFASTNSNQRGGGSNIPAVNTGGSLARLAFCDRSLYVLAPDRLTAFQLEGDRLVNRQETPLGDGQEALIREGNFLYVASEWALTIFDITACGLPRQTGRAPRFWSNDPVAVEGDWAVVALRNGDVPGANNPGRLLIYDVSNRNNPRVVVEHRLPHPVGVALHNGTLYVCDAVQGLLVFDFDGGIPANLLTRQTQRIAEADAVDLAVLPYAEGEVLLTVGQRSVAQYRIADGGGLTALSSVDASQCAQP